MINKAKLEISVISVSVMLLITVVFSVTVYSAPTPGTESEPVEKVSCHDRILSYERMGAYQDKEMFKLALSYCNPTSASGI
jgi:hypothetical protein